MAVFEAHFVAGEQAEKSCRGCFFIVAAFDPHLAADHKLAIAQFGQVRVHRCGAGVQRARAHELVPIGKHQLDRVQYRHGARGRTVQGFTQAALQRGIVNPAVAFGHANAFRKQLQALRCVAAAAQAVRAASRKTDAGLQTPACKCCG